jgi:uncharacterized membrane protein
MAQRRSPQTVWLQFLIIILLVLGIFFRFVNLDRKVYWHDETFTSLRIAGYTKAELVQQLFDGRVIGVEELQNYQRLNSGKSLLDTVRTLAVEEPQHPPLYYVTVRLWVQLFGNSVAIIRSLSVLISLLVFPAVYWLCLELFASPLVGWIAIALLSVSPFHVLYAQEARPYSLWTVTILLSSAALLRAMRLPSKLNWGIYAATLALSLYSFLLSGLVAIAHCIYVGLMERFRLSKTFIAYLLAASAGLFAFLPWLFILLTNLYSVDDTTSWSARQTPLFSLVKTWVGNLSRLFFDVNFDSDASLLYLVIPSLLSFLLIIYSLYFLSRTTEKRVWLFVFVLIGFTALAILTPDLILGGRRSSASRYLIPCYLGIQITVAYLFANQISNQPNHPILFSVYSSQKAFQAVMIALIFCGVVSDIFISKAETWWTKKKSDNHPQVARIINQATQPLVISSNYNFNIGEALSLSYLLAPKTKLQLVAQPNIPKVAEGFTDVFVFDPFPSLRRGIEKQNYKIQTVLPSKLKLGKLIKK